jgi:hypothetical protein
MSLAAGNRVARPVTLLARARAHCHSYRPPGNDPAIGSEREQALRGRSGVKVTASSRMEHCNANRVASLDRKRQDHVITGPAGH